MIDLNDIDRSDKKLLGWLSAMLNRTPRSKALSVQVSVDRWSTTVCSIMLAWVLSIGFRTDGVDPVTNTCCP